MTMRRGTSRSPSLAIAVALVYATVLAVFFAAGYIVGRAFL